MLDSLTERQRREREFYDQFSERNLGFEVDFGPIEGRNRCPGNTYWRLLELVQGKFEPGARLLDFGCGWGEYTTVFAKIGYQVRGFDISEQNVAITRSVAERHGLGDLVDVSVQTAEALAYPNAHFDVIAGVDILHHIDIPKAILECRRVLKPGGCAFFREPLYSVFFDPVRNWGPARRAFPNSKSFEKHITDDERKLDRNDLELIRQTFPDTDIEYSRLASRLALVAPWLKGLLEQIDLTIARLPGASTMCGVGILKLSKPTHGATSPASHRSSAP